MPTTLGIDLASQPKNTAMCVVDWDSRTATLTHGVDDARIHRELLGHAKVGIDAPFGWPAAFADGLAAHQRFEPWPEGDAVYRATDRFVIAHTSKRPLSVSTDRIAYCALRCARLIAGHPRDGSGLVVETYPGASLWLWLGRDRASYKGADGRERRAVLADAQLAHVDAPREQLIDCDDCLDALVCALVARAALLGRTIGPKDERLARREGWIHLPEPDSLSRL